jgi:hypothetical protein
MPTEQEEGFELRLREIDLRCDAYAADTSPPSTPAMLTCDRRSFPSTKCVDDVFGSWSLVASARRYEIDSPQTCKTLAKPPGYKLTSGYKRSVFVRNP